MGKKKNKAVQKHYTVQPDDTMYLIAQKVGIRINRLYRLNNLRPGEQAVAGTVLNLKTRKRK